MPSPRVTELSSIRKSETMKTLPARRIETSSRASAVAKSNWPAGLDRAKALRQLDDSMASVDEAGRGGFAVAGEHADHHAIALASATYASASAVAIADSNLRSASGRPIDALASRKMYVSRSSSSLNSLM